MRDAETEAVNPAEFGAVASFLSDLERREDLFSARLMHLEQCALSWPGSEHVDSFFFVLVLVALLVDVDEEDAVVVMEPWATVTRAGDGGTGAADSTAGGCCCGEASSLMIVVSNRGCVVEVVGIRIGGVVVCAGDVDSEGIIEIGDVFSSSFGVPKLSTRLTVVLVLSSTCARSDDGR